MKYKQGHKRQRLKFAWLPRKVGCRSIWFRKYMSIEEFRYTQTEGTKGKWYVLRETINYW